MLNLTEIQKEMEKLNGWSFEMDSIVKDFRFSSFSESKSFVSKVAAMAELSSHFPSITWDNLFIRIALTTRGQKCVTEADFKLAEEIDKVYKQ